MFVNYLPPIVYECSRLVNPNLLPLLKFGAYVNGNIYAQQNMSIDHQQVGTCINHVMKVIVSPYTLVTLGGLAWRHLVEVFGKGVASGLTNGNSIEELDVASYSMHIVPRMWTDQR